jgi:hypothetical protein
VGLRKVQLSVDELHRYRRLEQLREPFLAGCRALRLTGHVIGVDLPEENQEPADQRDGEAITQGVIAFRGRAATTLAEDQALWLWSSFDRCPHERLDDPHRVHVDPHGFVHLCQGILLGNTEATELPALLEAYRPDDHPIVGPLLKGGPAELVKVHGLPHEEGYADACHLCYSARLALRDRFPDHLGPASVYGSLDRKKPRHESAEPTPETAKAPDPSAT